MDTSNKHQSLLLIFLEYYPPSLSPSLYPSLHPFFRQGCSLSLGIYRYVGGGSLASVIEKFGQAWFGSLPADHGWVQAS